MARGRRRRAPEGSSLVCEKLYQGLGTASNWPRLWFFCVCETQISHTRGRAG